MHGKLPGFSVARMETKHVKKGDQLVYTAAGEFLFLRVDGRPTAKELADHVSGLFPGPDGYTLADGSGVREDLYLKVLGADGVEFNTGKFGFTYTKPAGVPPANPITDDEFKAMVAEMKKESHVHGGLDPNSYALSLRALAERRAVFQAIGLNKPDPELGRTATHTVHEWSIRPYAEQLTACRADWREVATAYGHPPLPADLDLAVRSIFELPAAGVQPRFDPVTKKVDPDTVPVDAAKFLRAFALAEQAAAKCGV